MCNMCRLSGGHAYMRTWFALSLLSIACVGDPDVDLVVNAAGPKPDLSVPTLSAPSATQTTITIQVCAGATGAPAGFSLQWETAADYAANGWSDTNGSYCGASFSGNAAGSRYNLDPGECVSVVVGDFLADPGFSTSCGGAL